jgi:membrane protein implicated in regulation of membrane protease activity
MKKARILLSLAVWVAILPYLGFPYSWKNVLFVVTGLVLAYISYSLYKENKTKTEEKQFDNFLENKDFSENNVITEENDFNKTDFK